MRARPASTTASAGTGSISGRVAGRGRPLRGVCAFAINVSTFAAVYVVTSKAGRYRIKGLRHGRYDVAFSATARHCPNKGNWLTQWYRHVDSPFPTNHVVNVPVSAGRVARGINGALRRGGEITGTVRNKAGRPLSGICAITGGIAPAGGGLAPAVTGRSGRYALRGLFPGRYLVEFRIGCGTKGNYAFQWWHGATVFERADRIRVGRHQVVSGINAVLLPGGTVTGTVSGMGTHGTGLAGVCVEAYDADNIEDADAVTAKNGSYELKGLATNNYTLVFDPHCQGSKPSLYLPDDRSVKVIAGHVVNGDAVLPAGSGIKGLVTDSKGHPLSGVCVQVQDDDEDSATTRSDGTYSILGVIPGSYPVGFLGGCGNKASVAPQYYRDQFDQFTADPVSFKRGTITPHIDAAMRPGGTIAGVVTSASGQPLSGICVGLVSPLASDLVNSGFAQAAFTRANGHYRLSNVTPGPYQVSVGCYGGRYASQWFNSQPDSGPANFVSVDAGTITRISAKLRLAGAISGIVTDSAKQRLNNICVLVADPKTQLLLNTDNNPVGTSHGYYRIGKLAPGRYVLQFADCNARPRYGTQWYKDRTTASFATRVRVRPGQTTTGIDPVLTKGGAITGTVTGPSGRPLAHVCVQGFDLAALAFQATTTDRHGRYRLTELDSGRYLVSFSPCYSRGPDLGAVSWPRPVRVTAPRTTAGISVRLRPAGRVSGVVADGGRPQTLVCVVAVPVNPAGSQTAATTEDNGRYVFNDLAPGKYRIYIGDQSCDGLSFEEPQRPWAPQWYRGQPTMATATTITVSAGHADTGIDADALRPSGVISGVVADASGAGVGGECVTAVPVRPAPDPLFGQFSPIEIAITGGTGRYALIGLLPGQYKIKFSVGCGTSGFVTQWWKNAGSAKSATVISLGNAPVTGVNATLRR